MNLKTYQKEGITYVSTRDICNLINVRKAKFFEKMEREGLTEENGDVRKYEPSSEMFLSDRTITANDTIIMMFSYVSSNRFSGNKEAASAILGELNSGQGAIYEGAKVLNNNYLGEEKHAPLGDKSTNQGVIYQGDNSTKSVTQENGKVRVNEARKLANMPESKLGESTDSKTVNTSNLSPTAQRIINTTNKKKKQQSKTKEKRKSGLTAYNENRVTKPTNPDLKIFGLKIGWLIVSPAWFIYYVWKSITPVFEFIRTMELLLIFLLYAVFRQSIHIAEVYYDMCRKIEIAGNSVLEASWPAAYTFGALFEILGLLVVWHGAKTWHIGGFAATSAALNAYRFRVFDYAIGSAEWFVSIFLSLAAPFVIFIVLETLRRKQIEYSESN